MNTYQEAQEINYKGYSIKRAYINHYQSAAICKDNKLVNDIITDKGMNQLTEMVKGYIDNIS